MREGRRRRDGSVGEGHSHCGGGVVAVHLMLVECVVLQLLRLEGWRVSCVWRIVWGLRMRLWLLLLLLPRMMSV